MSIRRFLAIVFIFGCVSVAWMVLGGSIFVRTELADTRNSAEMQSLWGPRVLIQPAPYGSPQAQGNEEKSRTAPLSSMLTADIRHHQRYKGLLWYSTFTVDFTGKYSFGQRPAEAPGTGPARTSPAPTGSASFFIFPLPPNVTQYDRLSLQLDDQPRTISQGEISAGRLVVPLEDAKPHVITVQYAAGGQEAWLYAPSGLVDNVSPRDESYAIQTRGSPTELRDFSLSVSTDFLDIDYPRGSRSPSQPAAAGPAGMIATWSYEHALTNQAMGVVVPRRQNAGPIAARMSFFAPVSLFFFFTVLFTVVVLRKIPLHPMHYLFIAGGFFAFHILLAYLVDLMDIHAAFWICAAVSVFLVVSYMRLVAGVKFAATFVASAQLVFLVGFSYAFFWEGRTGLMVTIAAIVTLFVLMQATGRINWSEVFPQRRNGLWQTVSPPPPSDRTP